MSFYGEIAGEVEVGQFMIYFENHNRGRAGFNNHVIPFTLCCAISNFLERDFYFDHEVPSFTLPHVHLDGPLKNELEHVVNASRCLVTDLLEIPNRRVFEIDRDTSNKFRVDDPMLTFMTDQAQREKFAETMIWNFFSLGRTPLVREELGQFDLIEFGPNSVINADFFFFLERLQKRKLLDSIRIRYGSEYEAVASRIILALGNYNSVHVRLGDFEAFYGSDGYAVEPENFAEYLNAVFPDKQVPILVATDEFQNKAVFKTMLDGFDYRFIDELILGEYFDTFRSLPFSDFNVLGVLNQLICSAGSQFVGTCRSTFTSVIHRLRQERYARADFDFLPDARVRRHLDADFRLTPDGKGFFEWNHYSAFSEHYEYPAWMREWNYELTAV